MRASRKRWNDLKPSLRLLSNEHRRDDPFLSDPVEKVCFWLVFDRYFVRSMGSAKFLLHLAPL